MCNYKVGDQDYFDNRPGLIRRQEETERSQLTTSIPALHNSSMRPGQVRQTASPTLSSHTLAFAFSSAPPSLRSSCWCVYMCVCNTRSTKCYSLGEQQHWRESPLPDLVAAFAAAHCWQPAVLLQPLSPE